MRSAFTFLVLVTVVARPAFGHYFFLIPGPDANSPPRLILGDEPSPDPSVAKDYGRTGAFWAVNRAGAMISVRVESTDAGVQLRPAEREPVALFGSVVAGVVLRGHAEPVLIVHHPRLVLDYAGGGAKSDLLKEQPQLSIRPSGAGGEVAFVVSANGKPHPHADVTVYVPGEARTRLVKTGAGGTTPAFSAPGRYAARVSWLEPTAGEYLGRKYAAVRHYATVVVEVGVRSQ